MTTPTNVSLVDWLEETERQAAESLLKTMTDDKTLKSLSQAWKSGFDALSSIPTAFRMPEPKFQWTGEGTPRGGLGNEYPKELFQWTKAAWVAAIRALAMQQGFVPSGWEEAKDLANLATSIDDADLPEFTPTPSETVLEQGGYRLRKMNPQTETSGEPILLISSLINRWYILDFLKDRSFVDILAAFKRPVYLLEGLAPSGPADDRSIPEIVAGPIKTTVDWILETHKTKTLSVVGYCMGGTFASILTARYPQIVSRLAIVAAPIKFSEGGLFTKWFSSEYMDVESVANAYDHIPATLVHLPFWWLRPTIKASKLVRLHRMPTTKDGINRFMAGEVWNHDNVDMSRGVFRSWARDLYQDDILVNGTMEVDGKTVHLEEITCPLLVISASYDAITPAASVEALADLASSKEKNIVRLETSHTGVFTSGKSGPLMAQAFNSWMGGTT